MVGHSGWDCYILRSCCQGRHSGRSDLMWASCLSLGWRGLAPELFCEVTYKNIQSILGKTLKENGFVDFVLNVEFDEDQARARELPDCIRSSRTRPERHVKALGCGLEECFLRGTIITHALFGGDWGRFVHFRCVWCLMCSCFLTFWLEYEWLPHPVRRTALVPFRTFLRVAQALQKNIILSCRPNSAPKPVKLGRGLSCNAGCTEISPGDLRPFRGGKQLRSECHQVLRQFRHMVHCMLFA